MFPSLLDALRRVPDPRAPNFIHPLESILAMAVCAMLCGRTTMLGITQWGEEHGPKMAKALGFKRPYTPSNGTLHYLFRKLDVAAFQRVLSNWLATTPLDTVHGTLECVAGKQAVSLDGKALRGVPSTPGVATVAAFLHQSRQVLDQEPVPHGDELGAVRTLLGRMPLDKHIVTGDALLTQRDIAKTILEKGATTSSQSKGIKRLSKTRSPRNSKRLVNRRVSTP